MKKLNLVNKLALVSILSTLLFSIFSYPAFAEPYNPRFPQPGNWFVDLGFTGYYYRYEERSHSDNSFFMRFTGPMYGYYYAIGYQPKCTNFRFALEGYQTWGSNLHYKSAGTGNAYDHDFNTAESRLLAFYPWDLNPDWAVEMYSGIGGRFVENDGYNSVSTTGAVGYVRHSHYTYLPIGLRFIRQINCAYVITHLEYDVFIEGKQDSYLYGGISNRQDSGVGLRAGLDLQLPSCFKGCDFLVGTFVRYWSIKDSTINADSIGRSYWLEPRNRTFEVGARIGVVF